MRIHNRIPKINNKWIRKINLEISYISDKEIIKRKNSYETFKLLLSKNKIIKNKNDKLSYKEIENISGISKRTYQRIHKEIKIKGSTYWTTMERKSRKPQNVRQSNIPFETKQEILEIRKINPTYSEKKIKIILERDYNVIMGHSTIGRILRELNSKSLITLKGSKLKKKLKPNEINDTKSRDFNKGYAKKWEYEKHIDKSKFNIGEMIQIDHLKINKNDKRFIQFNAIDTKTRIKISYCYNSATSRNAKDFLINRLIKELPFTVKSIQVDGGSEFRKDFEETCKELNIPLYVLPPYSPKYNGRVERVNKTDREEFWNNKELIKTCNVISDFNERLKEYTEKYNNYRPHEMLDYKTPMEYYFILNKSEKKVPDVFGD